MSSHAVCALCSVRKAGFRRQHFLSAAEQYTGFQGPGPCVEINAHFIVQSLSHVSVAHVASGTPCPFTISQSWNFMSVSHWLQSSLSVSPPCLSLFPSIRVFSNRRSVPHQVASRWLSHFPINIQELVSRRLTLDWSLCCQRTLAKLLFILSRLS